MLDTFFQCVQVFTLSSTEHIWDWSACMKLELFCMLAPSQDKIVCLKPKLLLLISFFKLGRTLVWRANGT